MHLAIISSFVFLCIKKIIKNRVLRSMIMLIFRVRFLEKYFPDSARFAREAEFLKLEQGDMSVNTYAARFDLGLRGYLS